jgi:MoxR-like ATPase
MVEGRGFVTPDDVKRLTVPVFAHRVVLHARTAGAQRGTAAAERLLESILTMIDVPL